MSKKYELTEDQIVRVLTAFTCLFIDEMGFKASEEGFRNIALCFEKHKNEILYTIGKDKISE